MDLNYKEIGEGDPLIILHGLFGSLDNWQTLARKFGEERRVFIIDQRNHGRSFWSDEHDYPSMANDVKEFIEGKELEKVDIIGHSMGGKTAMYLALEHPELIRKLIVVDMGVEKNKPGHDEIFEAMFALKLEDVERRVDADSFLQSRIPDFGVRQFLLKNLERKKEGGFQWKMNLKSIYKNYEHILSAVPDEVYEGEVMFVRGGKSDYVKNKDMERIRAIFPQVILETVEDAGHWVHAESPETFFNLVNEYLNK